MAHRCTSTILLRQAVVLISECKIVAHLCAAPACEANELPIVGAPATLLQIANSRAQPHCVCLHWLGQVGARTERAGELIIRDFGAHSHTRPARPSIGRVARARAAAWLRQLASSTSRESVAS